MDKSVMAEVTQQGILDMQVCVPESWDNEAVLEFANRSNPCGTEKGWCIREEGDPLLLEHKERMDCEERKGFVHIMLDA